MSASRISFTADGIDPRATFPKHLGTPARGRGTPLAETVPRCSPKPASQTVPIHSALPLPGRPSRNIWERPQGSRHPSRRDRTQMFPEACRPNRSDPPSAARRPVREIDPRSPLAELVRGRQALGPGPIARTGSRPHPRETPVPRGFGMALRVEPRAPARPGRELASRATRCRQARDRDPGQDARLPSHGRASATPRELARVRSHPGRRPPSCLVHSAPVRPLRLRTAGMNPLAPWPGASQHAR